MKIRDFGIFFIGVAVGCWAMKSIVDLRRAASPIERFIISANTVSYDDADDKPPEMSSPPTGDKSPKTSSPPAGETENFIRGDIRDAFNKLATSAGIKLIMSDRVQGFITTNLDHLTPREEIEVIANAQGLMVDEGKNGVIYIKAPEEKAQEPREHGYVTLKNARAADIKNLLRSQLWSGVEPQVDARTNTIFFIEDRSHVDAIRKFLELVDRPGDWRPPNQL